MFLQKTIIGLALSAIVAPGVIQITNATNQVTQSKLNDGVPSKFVIEIDTSYEFKFQVILGNSTYNGFPGFINQIRVPANWKISFFFFQWLDDNDFHYSTGFSNLNLYTQHNFWNWPFKFDNRLEAHMGSFGPWTYGKTDTAAGMIYAIDNTFLTNAEKAFQNATNPRGIQFNFDIVFYWYHSVAIKYLDKGHTYQVL